MTRKPSRRPRDAFGFTPEMGQRLRTLRQEAGLNQLELARRMGRTGRKAGNICSRLETGRVRYPSLGLIADYLRACRAGFADLLEVLDEYTGRPPADEAAGQALVTELVSNLPEQTGKQVAGYDVKTTVARRFSGMAALAPGERLVRASKLAAGKEQHDRLDLLLKGLWPRLSARATLPNRLFASNYVHKLWAVLMKSRGRPVRWRALHVADALVTALAEKALPGPDVHLLHDAVRELFQNSEMARDLGPVQKRPRAKQRRTWLSDRMKLPAEARQSEARVVIARLEALRLLQQVGVDRTAQHKWHAWVSGLTGVAMSYGPGAAEREEKVRQALGTAQDPELGRQLAAAFFAAYDRASGKPQPA